MANPNFGSILDTPATAAERPPVFPRGNFIAAISGLPRRGKSDKKGTDFIEYTLKPMQAIEGTYDEEELANFIATRGPIGNVPQKLTFYITENSAYRHREFLEEDLQLELEEDEGHWAAAQKTNGQQVMITVKHTPRNDGKGVYSEISGTAPVEE